MNIIVAEVEKRAKEAAQQLRDAGRDEMIEYAMKAQREHEAAGMRYAHAMLKAVEIMEKALNDQGAEVTEDNTASGMSTGTTNDVWVRDDADADAIMQEIQQTLSDIADQRIGQDDEFAKQDHDTLYDTSDLVQRIREYVAGKADVTAQTTLDDVASAKPVQAVSEAVSTSDDQHTMFQTIDAEERTIKVTTDFVEVLTGPDSDPMVQRYNAEDVLNVRHGIDQYGSWVELKIKHEDPDSRRDSYPVGIDFNSATDASAFYTAMSHLIEWGQTKTAPTKPDSAYKVTIGGLLYDTYPTHKAALDAAEPLRIHHTRRVAVMPV